MCRPGETQRSDVSTETNRGKLIANFVFGQLLEDDDEMYIYVKLTEAAFLGDVKTFEVYGSGDIRKRNLPIRKSLFAHVPPYIIFRQYDSNSSIGLPATITKHLSWRSNSRYRVPRMVRKTVAKSGFGFSRLNVNWSGFWGLPLPSVQTKTLKAFQKINYFPGTVELGRKDRLWRNINRMIQRFGCSDFDFTPKTYVLPEDEQRFRRFSARHNGVWITKPPSGSSGQGIRVVSKLSEVPTKCHLVVQRYINRPRLIQGMKFDLRLYVLVTSVDPLIVYLYSEGIVRFATSKYLNDVDHLYDRYMHLTNTSVNKSSPMFRANGSVEKCKGSIWSLTSLWSYLSGRERADIPKLWERIKDIVIKTILSAESTIVDSSESALPSSYNAYQLLGFDVLLDHQLKPWLLEVNNYPSMGPDTPLCSIVKRKLARDILNLAGFHIPDLVPPEDRQRLMERYKLSLICHDERFYKSKLTKVEIEKQYQFVNVKERGEYFPNILDNLTPDDVRHLVRYEDEATQAGNFEKIFPTKYTNEYERFFEKPRYYNRLLDAWEEVYGSNRKAGISRLQKLCIEKFHLLKIETINP